MYYLSPMYFLCHRPFISLFILSFASFRAFLISIAGSVLLIFLVDPSLSFHPSVFLLTRFRVTCVYPSSWFGKFSVLLIFLSSHILLLYIQYSHCFFLSCLFSYTNFFPSTSLSRIISFHLPNPHATFPFITLPYLFLPLLLPLFSSLFSPSSSFPLSFSLILEIKVYFFSFI